MSDKTIGLILIIGVSGVGPDSDTGLDTGGRFVAEVGPDPLADPEGLTGVKGKPADGDPAGLPLGSMGPESAPEGAMGPKILFMASRKCLITEGDASGPGNSGYLNVVPGTGVWCREARDLEEERDKCLELFFFFLCFRTYLISRRMTSTWKSNVHGNSFSIEPRSVDGTSTGNEDSVGP